MLSFKSIKETLRFFVFKQLASHEGVLTSKIPNSFPATFVVITSDDENILFEHVRDIGPSIKLSIDLTLKQFAINEEATTKLVNKIFFTINPFFGLIISQKKQNDTKMI